MLLSTILIVAFVSCKTNNKSDVADKKEVLEVTVGKQVWKVKNLDVDTFLNGDKLFIAHNQDEWDYAWENKIPACSIDQTITDEFIKYPSRAKKNKKIPNSNDTSAQLNEDDWVNYHNGQYQGRLYNWWAVIDKRSIAPKGYRVPSHDDFIELFKSVQPNMKFAWDQVVKPKLKQIGWYVDKGEPSMAWWTCNKIYEDDSYGGWIEGIDFKTIGVFLLKNIDADDRVFVHGRQHQSYYYVKVLKNL